jgi:hypothetical protein
MNNEQMDLYDRIKSGEFTNHQTPPTKPRKPMLSTNHTSSEVEVYVDCLKNYEEAIKEYSKNITAYRLYSAGLTKQFKYAAIEYCGISDHPKAERAWSMAWDRSSSDGLIGVLETLEELSDLMKP